MFDLNVFAVYKPSGLSSYDVIRILKRVYGIKKIGHGGTLDPLASGILIIGINNGTKSLNQCLNYDKKYRARIKFNLLTDSYDITGKVIKTDHKKITLEAIRNALDNFFLGDIKQRPPIYSAVKINGRKAYEYARQNKEIEIPVKEVSLYGYEIVNYDEKEQELTIEINVSKGFYVRSFAFDLGKELGSFGTITYLQRTEVGPYTKKDCISLYDLPDSLS
ncbi:tRNA pseudouridine(55) synthase TruB [Ureaplasma canigenitalium]|uniref:tRNA pseudouridine(55) synthase TruB n=1 Tax=Ureaplasma canigenitalium TaxID=42092 RepID=UPI00069019AF|nr:tRNA pseudouridine(55) synthase TruB [Ureaplasma canigenitalium]